MTEEKSFAELLDQDFAAAQTRLIPGQKVEAVVVRIGKEWIFVDLGAKSEGCIARNELVDKDGNLTVQEGDKVEVFFLSERNNEQRFTTRVSGADARNHLMDAYQSGIPVEGTVDQEIKGGFSVKIAGKIRAFCPYSQMSLRRVDDTEQYIGEQFTFKISEYKENGRNIIVSRRAILEEEREQKKEELRETLEKGMTVRGTITSIRNFGAFLDIGGLEGLIPVSEICWGRVDDIHEKLEVGQEVSATVMKLDWENDRISFSLKETLPNPWDAVAGKYAEGSSHVGKVVRLLDFGAFVELEPGIDGLIHISRLGAGRRINHPREVVQLGETVEVRIDSVDTEKKRLSLSIPVPAGGGKGKDDAVKTAQAKEDDEQRQEYKRHLEKADSKGSMGTLGDLLKKKLGN